MRKFSFIVLVVLTGCASQLPLRPFSTDGCSLFPDRSPTGKKDWCHCCVIHDLAYWRGGTAEDRCNADNALRACMQEESGSKTLASLMYAQDYRDAHPSLECPTR